MRPDAGNKQEGRGGGGEKNQEKGKRSLPLFLSRRCEPRALYDGNVAPERWPGSPSGRRCLACGRAKKEQGKEKEGKKRRKRKRRKREGASTPPRSPRSVKVAIKSRAEVCGSSSTTRNGCGERGRKEGRRGGKERKEEKEKYTEIPSPLSSNIPFAIARPIPGPPGSGAGACPRKIFRRF